MSWCRSRSRSSRLLDRLSPKGLVDNPRLQAFQAGMQAFANRHSIADNPHAFDSLDYFSRERGWSEAREETQRLGRPRLR